MFLIVCLLGIPECFSQDKETSIPLDHFYVKRQKSGGLRFLLSKLRFGLSTGYGSTNFKHSLDGFVLHQMPDSVPKIFTEAAPGVAYTNWVNKVTLATDNTTTPSSFLVNSDTADIGFKSKSFAIPLTLTVHFEFLQRYRIGAGYSFDFTKVGDFKPTSYGNDINSFSSDVSSFFMKRYFLILGASVYRYYDYLLTIDANIGGYGLGKDFDKSLIKRGMFFNVGATVERELSEYFRLFVRPSFEFKSYDLNIPETGQSIKHQVNAFYFNIGASYRIPELRRCFHKQCKAQLNHAHGNKEYRSRVHPIWKKQNPQTGENYPELIKYKGKNKRKLNPY